MRYLLSCKYAKKCFIYHGFCLLKHDALTAFFIGSLVSISCTLSCFKLCICFFRYCVAFAISKKTPIKRAQTYCLKGRNTMYIRCTSHSISRNRNSKVGSIALMKKLESLELNTTKLLSNLVRMSSPLLPH